MPPATVDPDPTVCVADAELALFAGAAQVRAIRAYPPPVSSVPAVAPGVVDANAEWVTAPVYPATVELRCRTV